MNQDEIVVDDVEFIDREVNIQNLLDFIESLNESSEKRSNRRVRVREGCGMRGILIDAEKGKALSMFM